MTMQKSGNLVRSVVECPSFQMGYVMSFGAAEGFKRPVL